MPPRFEWLSRRRRPSQRTTLVPQASLIGRAGVGTVTEETVLADRKHAPTARVPLYSLRRGISQANEILKEARPGGDHPKHTRGRNVTPMEPVAHHPNIGGHPKPVHR
jgi:hypothetical protein